MANRAMEQKRLKMKRMKRLLPRNYYADYVPVGTGPHKEVMGEYRARSRGLAFDAQYIAELEARQKYHGVPPGRKEAMTKAQELIMRQQQAMMRTIESLLSSRMCFDIFPKNIYQHVQCFFNAQKTRYIIVHHDFKHQVIRRSKEYYSKNQAVTFWHMSRVTWVEKALISS